MRISLITVACHSSKWIEGLLPTVEGVDEIVVVDHSEDQEEARRLEALPIHRLELAPNRGYGAGLNQGCHVASGEVLLFANPDVRFGPGTIDRLAALTTTPYTGAVGPMLLWNEAHPWQLPHSADHTWFLEWTRAVLPRLARSLYLRQMDRAWTATCPTSVPVIGGAVMATTRRVFELSGGFDERFFLFFEENDWCRRLRNQGQRLVVDPEALVYHDWGHSIGPRAASFHRTSMLQYRRIHLPRWYRRIQPTPPAPKEPTIRESSSSTCRKGDDLLLTNAADAIPAARLVAPSASDDPAEFLPPSLRPGSYLILTRSRRRIRLLSRFQIPQEGS